MRSNCQVFARIEFWRRIALWLAAGRPRHLKPWIKQSPSERAPFWIMHASVGGMGLPSLEYVPKDARKLPWWKLPVVLFFRGRVRPADFPHTEPTAAGELDTPNN